MSGMSWLALIRAAQVARAKSGRSMLAQFMDMARLRLSRHAIFPNEYYDYCLFSKSQSEQATFLGTWAKDRVYRVNNPQWLAVGNDKLLTYLTLKGLGLPYPKVLAVCHPIRHHSDAALLRDVGETERYLLEQATYPFFSKPAISYLGYEGYLIKSLDQARSMLHFGDGSVTSVADFARRCMLSPQGAVLFQELIVPHDDIMRLAGPRVATARVMVLNLDEGPLPFRAALRIPVGRSMIDNFRHGETGNLLGEVDIETGCILRVIASVGLRYQTAEVHPDTGAPMRGRMLSDWHNALDLVRRASAAMPGLRLLSWDVAFSDRGPLLIEVNPRGDFDLIQHTHGDGMVREPLQRLYVHHGGRI